MYIHIVYRDADMLVYVQIADLKVNIVSLEKHGIKKCEGHVHKHRSCLQADILHSDALLS